MPLPPELYEAVKREVASSALANRLMETLEIVIDFLCSTGGSQQTLNSSLADMRLAEYLRTVLLQDEELPCRAVAQQVSQRASQLDI